MSERLSYVIMRHSEIYYNYTQLFHGDDNVPGNGRGSDVRGGDSSGDDGNDSYTVQGMVVVRKEFVG